MNTGGKQQRQELRHEKRGALKNKTGGTKHKIQNHDNNSIHWIYTCIIYDVSTDELSYFK